MARGDTWVPPQSLWRAVSPRARATPGSGGCRHAGPALQRPSVRPERAKIVPPPATPRVRTTTKPPRHRASGGRPAQRQNRGGAQGRREMLAPGERLGDKKHRSRSAGPARQATLKVRFIGLTSLSQINMRAFVDRSASPPLRHRPAQRADLCVVPPCPLRVPAWISWACPLALTSVRCELMELALGHVVTFGLGSCVETYRDALPSLLQNTEITKL